MSKKKAKAAARKAPKKTAPKKAAKKSVSKSRARGRLTGVAATSRTLTVTIFLYRTSHGNRIRTSPQRLYANPGDHVEWNVVNLIDGSDVPVTITWPEAGPWGKDPIAFRSWHRMPFGDPPSGRYKYVVSALDAQEDPEVEMPENN